MSWAPNICMSPHQLGLNMHDRLGIKATAQRQGMRRATGPRLPLGCEVVVASASSAHYAQDETTQRTDIFMMARQIILHLEARLCIRPNRHGCGNRLACIPSLEPGSVG